MSKKRKSQEKNKAAQKETSINSNVQSIPPIEPDKEKKPAVPEQEKPAAKKPASGKDKSAANQSAVQEITQPTVDKSPKQSKEEPVSQPATQTTSPSQPAVSTLAQVPPLENPTGCLIRSLWMIVGKILLAIFFLILVRTGKVYGIIDVIYWLVISGMIWLRYIDIRYYHGKTGTGEKATLQDWVKYTVLLIISGAFFWFVAHAISKWLIR